MLWEALCVVVGPCVVRDRLPVEVRLFQSINVFVYDNCDFVICYGSGDGYAPMGVEKRHIKVGFWVRMYLYIVRKILKLSLDK